MLLATIWQYKNDILTCWFIFSNWHLRYAYK